MFKRPLLLLFLLLVVSSVSHGDWDDNSRLIAAQVSPAVVGIRCEKETEGAPGRVQQFYGTGVVIRHDGLVLTNITVVPQTAHKITIFFKGGNILPAQLLEWHRETEAVLLQAERARELPFVPLGDSSQLALGHRVYSFGNPFHAIEQDGQVAVSLGAVSGLYGLTDNGEGNESVYLGPVIETDAALNPGSDGGPLISSQGALLGILSLGFQRERRMGVAIPIHHLLRHLKALDDFSLASLQPTLESPVQQQMGAVAQRLSPGVVWLEIEREPEAPWKPPHRPTSREQKQEFDLLEIMQRPPGFVTGIAIEQGKYVLTSAFHLSHNKQAKWVNGLSPLIKRILVHAQGLSAPVEATLVARHEPYDLALLSVAQPLPQFLEIGRSSQLRVGSLIGVLGRQRGANQVTITSGLVSAVERTYGLVKMLQSEAAVNYANSGGPVVDLSGEVVGLATLIHPQVRWGVNSGVALFVGADDLRQVLLELLKGTAIRNPTLPFLGVGLWVEHPTSHGAPIATVNLNSAAFKAGVRPGDVIVSLDGKPIGEWPDLVRMITSKAIGQEISFEVEREGKTLTLKGVLGERPWFEDEE